MSGVDDFFNIDTPENVIFGYEVVGIGSRFLASLIDTLIIGGILLFVNLAVGFVDRFVDNTTILVAISLLLSFAIIWGYFILFELQWNGQSPGKRRMGLRVIRQDGTPITLTESVIRNLVRLIDFFPAMYGVGILTMFIDGQSRRLGDLAAGTLVVRDEDMVTLDTLKQAAARPTLLRPPGETETAVRQWPLHLLNDEDIRLASSFLERRQELQNSNQLAYQITRRLMKKMGVPATQAVFMSEAVYILNTIVTERQKDR